MSDFTYEREKNNNPLETYEWDNVWWEHATTKGATRVCAKETASFARWQKNIICPRSIYIHSPRQIAKSSLQTVFI